MSAERPTDSILDLLYGEISEEEASQMREELAESADLQAELTSYEDLLARVRESMPVEEVSASTHTSIMDAARAAVDQRSDGPMTRRVSEPGRTGFWSRVGRGQGSQLALVAAVLVAGLFVVKAVEKGDSPRPSASDISAAREPAPTLAAPEVAEEEIAADDPAAPAPALDALAEGGEAVADQWSAEKPAEIAAPTPADESDVRNSLAKELGRSEKSGRKRDSAAPPAPARGSTKAKRSKSYRPKKPTSSEPKTTATRTANKSNFASLEDKFDNDVLGADSQYASESKKEQRSDDLKMKDSIVTGKGSGEAVAVAEPEPVQQAPAAAAADREAEEQAYEPPANSIGAVNSYFRRNDYAGAIRAADEFLATNPQASRTDKARAIHVKAQSLVKQGRYNEADRLLESLQKNYPSYQPDSVNNAREELKRKKPTKRKSKKRKPKADKKAYEAPSSIDSFD